MDELLPWLAVMGWGLLHGLSPTSGWILAADQGLQAGSATLARRALLPLALGHVASVAALALAWGGGWAPDRALAQRLAGVVLVGMAVLRWRRGARQCMPGHPRLGRAGLAAWSGLMAAAHGTGLMLVPALAPLCLAGGAARAITTADSLLLAAATLVVHLGAMLLSAGALATGLCRGAVRCPALAAGAWPRRVCSLALAGCGLWLLGAAA